MADYADDSDEKREQDIEDLLDSFTQMANIAEEIDKDILGRMSTRVIDDYTTDKSSREDWEKVNAAGLELARQLAKDKNYAGEKVNNVKYPLIATSAIHFAARTYPNIVSANEVVKVRVIGRDPGGLKAARGVRVSTHMSYQILEQMDDWEGDMDQLLTILSITGCMFKKTYHDPLDRRVVSKMILPDDFVVNYFAKSLETASTLTHVIQLTPNEIYERIHSGAFSDFKYTTAGGTEKQSDDNEDKPHTFLEQHRYWDLDDDGYQEPYIVTVHEESKTVVRVVARFDKENVERDDDDEIIRIKPNHLFTRYLFMPAFDGSIYGMGFGILLSPINETINATLNNMLDAAGLAMRQAGFIGDGVNLGRGGSVRFKKGEWKKVRFSGDDLRKNLVPLPVSEPGMVMFSLLGLMIEAGKELSSVTDVMRGEQPSGDVPATTTLAMIEQGLKVFSAIYRRVHRSLRSEYKKIRRLNEMWVTDDEYNMVLDEEEEFRAKDEYGDEFFDIIPISSTADVSDIQRIIKGKSLMELLGQGLNDQVIQRRYLEALQIPDVEEILTVPEQPESFEVTVKKAELEIERDKVKIDRGRLQVDAATALEKMNKMRAESIKALADAESKEVGDQLGDYAAMTARMKVEIDGYNNLMGLIMGGQNADNQGSVRDVAAQQSSNAGAV